MSGFQHLKVDGFRRLCGVDCELRPLTVMIGANGSGKTSVLEVMSLLAASADGRLADRISELGGISSVLTAERKERMSFQLTTGSKAGALQYDVSIEASGIGYAVRAEQLTQVRKGIVALRAKGVSETGLSNASSLLKPGLEFQERLASSVHYHNLDVSTRSQVRLPQPMRPATLPGKYGEDLVTCLFQMREADPDRFETIEDTLKAAFPGFEKLSFPPVAAGTLALIWRDRNFPSGFNAHQLSGGMLRFLWLATLLQSSALPEVVLLDEPEVSLHPQLLSLLADLLREASQRSQIIVATHSDRLVRFLNPSEVLVVDPTDDGLAKLTWANSLDLDKWLDEYTLDQVWAMGQLGGRP